MLSGEEDFAQARDAEATAEELLMDDGWKLVEVEPEAVAVNGNGANCNGHRDGIGPTVELVPVNGRHANGNGNGNGNGHHDDEALEAQQTLFSWAEFMAEEPVKPKGRSRKPQPATLSMFEWALTLEQEREPVGAGHQAGRKKGRGHRIPVSSPFRQCIRAFLVALFGRRAVCSARVSWADRSCRGL